MLDFVPLQQLNEGLDGKEVWVRGRLHTSRVKGKTGFVVIRSEIYTLQGLLFVGLETSKQLLKFIEGVSKESIIDVQGTISKVAQPIVSCSQQNVELKIKQFWVVSAAEPRLPLQIEDASRPETDDSDLATVKLDTRLDNRLEITYIIHDNNIFF